MPHSPLAPAALSKVSLGRMSNGSPGPEVNVAMQQLMAAAAAQQSGRRSLDAATAHLKRLERLENPAIVNARCEQELSCVWC